MIPYLARRVGHGILLLFGVSVLMFLLLQAAPGEFLSDVKLNSQISPGDSSCGLRAQYGLDQPLQVRYWKWIKSSAKGDFGYSFAYNAPASSLLWPRACNTLLLTMPGTRDPVADRCSSWGAGGSTKGKLGSTASSPAGPQSCSRCPMF